MVVVLVVLDLVVGVVSFSVASTFVGVILWGFLLYFPLPSPSVHLFFFPFAPPAVSCPGGGGVEVLKLHEVVEVVAFLWRPRASEAFACEGTCFWLVPAAVPCTGKFAIVLRKWKISNQLYKSAILFKPINFRCYFKLSILSIHVFASNFNLC